MEEELLSVPSEDAVVSRFMNVYQNRIQESLTDFCQENCTAFSGYESDEEQQHDRMTLFNQYEALFEKYVVDFLEQENLSPKEFLSHCKKIKPTCPNAALNLQLTMAAFDYKLFATEMSKLATTAQQAAKAAEDMGI